MEVPEKPRVIAGRYELESLIGEGGMASVWRARDRTLERAVAVKLLFARDERDTQNLIDQFLREARIAASVQHRNVIHIVDFGSTEQQPFMVMELLEGKSLGERIKENPSLSLSELVHVAGLTLRGLTAVHDAGIIHRDLKPDNIFLTTDASGAPFPKILDFGISRSVEPRSGRRSALTTKEGIIVGTPEYMSPEQARGIKGIDHRTDIYSMGVILYEAVTGRVPFSSENVGDLIIQIVTGTTQPAHEINPGIPIEVSDVIAKAMARRVEDRYQDAASMQEALLSAASAAPNTEIRRSLSDLPPTPSFGRLEARNSQERLRTLEFSLGDDEDDPPLELEQPAPSPRSPNTLELKQELRTARRRSWAGVLGTLALLGAAVAGFLHFQGGEQVQASLASADPGPSEAAVVGAEDGAGTANGAGEPAPEVPAVVTVQLRSVPKDASIELDGEPAPGDVLELPRDGRNRIITVKAQGKSPWQVVHHATADATYDVLLVEEVQPAARQAPRKRTGKSGQTKKARKSKPPSVLRKLDF